MQQYFGANQIFVILSALIGGIVGYVSVEFRQFYSGVSRAYHKTIMWKPDRLWWRAYASKQLAYFALLLSFCLPTVGLFLLCKIGIFRYVTFGFFVVFGACSFCQSIIFLLTPLYVEDDLKNLMDKLKSSRERAVNEYVHNNLRFAIDFNPFSVIVKVGQEIIRLFLLLLENAQKVLVAWEIWLPVLRNTAISTLQGIGAFLWQIIVEVHSRKRVICFVYAAIGTLIAHSYGSALIGAVTGGVIGALSYEIISVRLLKLVPK